ncbi:MAG TPA: hypothetical protein VK668_22730 [Mucilaginibacter sp.]|nr:hypothetical protein [Mucilaginibacter sp.]
MPQAKPGIATTILAPDPVGEGFVEISPNKTLFIQKLTNNEPIRPQIIEGLQTVEDVFDHFKPACDVELDREDGSTTKETFKFAGLGDFDTKNLVNQSSFLADTNVQHDVYLRIVKQLGTNKSLKNVIENPETRQAFIDSLKVLISELEEN